MITIPIKLSGDYWINDEEVEHAMRSAPSDQSIDIDFISEGVSTTASGIAARLEEICEATGRSMETVRFINNPNLVERTAFWNCNRDFPVFMSHFFPMSRAYWRDTLPVALDAKTFGFFVGRRTVARMAMLYECWHHWPQRFLFSAMRSKTNGMSADEVEIPRWFDNQERTQFEAWRHRFPVQSLDDKTVRDQYVANPVTNASILQFYDRFHIELVAETYVRGDTFFPTEKTVRPIMAGKPLLVYGPKHFLSRLRHMGFQTWSTVWDESYDDLEGPNRWRAIKRIIADLDIASVAEPAGVIAQHNRQHLSDLIRN